MRRLYWLALLVLVFPCMALGARERPDYMRGKKLTCFGWGNLSPQFVLANLAQAEGYGFDGIAFSWPAVHSFSGYAYTEEEVAQEIRALRAIKDKARRLRHNFLRMNVTPGRLDWFDDQRWAAITSNFRLAARIAKQCGLEGILFDMEEYDGPVFTYADMPQRGTKTFLEYAAEVEKRGAQIMRAINEEYPRMTLLLLFAYSSIYGEEEAAGSKEAAGRLTSFFLDGFLKECQLGFKMVDGFEMSYGTRSPGGFRAAARLIRKSRTLSNYREKYDKHLKVGFAVWMDRANTPDLWHLTNFDKNWLTPEELRRTLHAALKYSDEYVWLYNESPKWLPRESLPEEYAQAVRNCRERPEVEWVTRPSEERIKGGRFTSATKYPAPADLFADLEREHDTVIELPLVWKFRLDPEEIGKEEAWFREDLDDSKWDDIRIDEWWDPQGYDYNGIAWYRVSFPVPEEWEGKEMYLCFGAVDETCEVWVNGRWAITTEALSVNGWDRRFGTDVTQLITPGAENQVAVRVEDTGYVGGIWRPVRLFARQRSDR